jgi:CRISPR-associated endonuclease Cas1
VQLQLTNVVNGFKQRFTGTPSARPQSGVDLPASAVPIVAADPSGASGATPQARTAPRDKRSKRPSTTASAPPTDGTPTAPDDGSPIVCEPVPVTNGVAVIYGYGVKVAVTRGHLFVSDGICDERRAGYFNRATSGLRHLVIIGHTGSISLGAFRWLHDLGVGISMIDQSGEVIFASGPSGADNAHLRRAQALAAANDVGLELTRWLLTNKIGAQARVLRDLGQDDEADHFGAALDTLEGASTMDDCRAIEAYAANQYWREWIDVPIRFARKDDGKVPAHWTTFGQRKRNGNPRNATTPGNAMLNLLFAVLETEARIACLAVGLDPGLAFNHRDTPYRDSLALDVIEPVRPEVERWLLAFLRERTFSKSDFFERDDGVCRVSSRLARELCTTAPLWRKLLGPVAERVAQTLAQEHKPGLKIATTLTEANRRASRRLGRRIVSEMPPETLTSLVSGSANYFGETGASEAPSRPSDADGKFEQISPPANQGRVNEQDETSIAGTSVPRGRASPRNTGAQRSCPECGAVITKPRAKYCSERCHANHNREVVLPTLMTSGAEALAAARAAGVDPAHGGEAAKIRGQKNARNQADFRAWEQAHPDVDLLAERERFLAEIVPRLAAIPTSKIVAATGLSNAYARMICSGRYVPHPRHFATFVALLEHDG